MCSLAERKRQVVRDELARVAAMMLSERSYGEITVDDIAGAAGVSRRTFFRYFSSKEDVFLRFMEEFGVHVVAALAERPADEDPATALRQSFVADIEAHDDGKALDLGKTTLGIPALHARYLEYLAHWKRDLGTELARRLGIADDSNDVRPILAAAIA